MIYLLSQVPDGRGIGKAIALKLAKEGQDLKIYAELKMNLNEQKGD